MPHEQRSHEVGLGPGWGLGSGVFVGPAGKTIFERLRQFGRGGVGDDFTVVRPGDRPGGTVARSTLPLTNTVPARRNY